MATLERALAIAAEAHRGQVDKAGEPYLLHPIRVMLRVRGDEARLVAVLHDVVEDSPAWTLDRLRTEGFPDPVVRAVDLLTRRGDESYDTLIDRAGSDPLSRRVKLADLEDNMMQTRISRPGPQDRERLERYRHAHARLSGGSPPTS